ncbi:O-phospho-L-seryl-tRNA:Cys-tRNA synthase [Methanotrichaceae archaeon M04Ac]|uniref:O-phospho-L-seryl-tRNA:Cys-tRNA synthase n=1 Tax=Candidatus Methanocrinis alkalitolerans TaxID=3033395 RepID=A0ABT5XES3_9EURY|nr:O-phospho-L-seryl-tRNA:Cys-tRNA synthase [Candidatus Methanocrinis alkalitolerans]MDF0593136.1 O-phospho-L-seryl-tRNA:Cys-tRNA synthase [Candidatus Methanocrinis alkalitolerans]
MNVSRRTRIQKTYEALFALEDVREIFRQSLPSGLDEGEEREFAEALARVRGIIDEIEDGGGEPPSGRVCDGIEVRSREEDYININPIQAAGRLTPEARKAVISYGDGYSTCDHCRKPFRLDKIARPPVEAFHAELAEFLHMDVARVVPGARRGFQAVTQSLLEKGDFVIVSSLAHYTEFLAVEVAGGVVREVPLNERNVVTAEATAQKIEEVKAETGTLPKLIMIDHFDYQFGNEHEVRGIGKVAKDYGIPFLYNGAYTVGVMPVDGKEIGADFVVGSGHKSMAAMAPSGVLATTEEWAERVFRTTEIVGDVTNRRFGIKEVENMGCTLMGGTLISMIASFPRVKARTAAWDDEVAKSNRFLRELSRIEGTRVLSELPRRHTLSKVDTTESFDRVAKTHKRRGYFLSDELKRRGIIGEFAGATRVWKLNTYGLTPGQVDYAAGSFLEIAERYGLKIS